MGFDPTKRPYKVPERSVEPSEEQPKEVPKQRKIPPEELKILEDHKKWVESEGIEGKKANLYEANLQQANLSFANLQEASLVKANLQQADLGHANLQQADLYEANLSKADLRGANLTDVKNLTQAQLNQACVDEHTKLPKGLTRPEPCSEEELSQK